MHLIYILVNLYLIYTACAVNVATIRNTTTTGLQPGNLTATDPQCYVHPAGQPYSIRNADYHQAIKILISSLPSRALMYFYKTHNFGRPNPRKVPYTRGFGICEAIADIRFPSILKCTKAPVLEQLFTRVREECVERVGQRSEGGEIDVPQKHRLFVALRPSGANEVEGVSASGSESSSLADMIVVQ